MRGKIEAEFEPKLNEAVAMAEARARVVLADAQAKAADELKAAVASARVKEREIEMAGVSRLLESIRGLDGATTLSEVLDALALAAAREAARAAVVVLRSERIHGWKLTGFGPRDAQPKLIDLPLSRVRRDCPRRWRGARGDDARQRHRVGGSGIRKIVDRSHGARGARGGGWARRRGGVRRCRHARWPRSARAELLARADRSAGAPRRPLSRGPHDSEDGDAENCDYGYTGCAGCARVHGCTGAQGAQGAQGASVHRCRGAPSTSTPGTAVMQITDGVAAAARRTARLLVSEIRLFHEPAVNEGRKHRNLLSRLAPEIEKARQAYNEQVPAGVRGDTDFFHQELIRTLAGGDATLLGNAI